MNWYKIAQRRTDAQVIKELIVFNPAIPVVLQCHKVAEAIINVLLDISFPDPFDDESLNKQTIVNDVALMINKVFKGSHKPVPNEMLDKLSESIAKYLDHIAYLISIEPKKKIK